MFYKYYHFVKVNVVLSLKHTCKRIFYNSSLSRFKKRLKYSLFTNKNQVYLFKRAQKQRTVSI